MTGSKISGSREDDRQRRPSRVGIFYHSDPAGHVPGGIETVIRGIMQWAPPDLEYTLFGATSDPNKRPVGVEALLSAGQQTIRYVPLVSANPTGARGRIPLTVRYMWALHRYLSTPRIMDLDILDFHRIEQLLLFKRDTRPKNVMMHQDMAVIRSKDCDIGWRHAPRLYEFLESQLFQTADRVFCVRQSAVERYRATYPDIEDRFMFTPTWFEPGTFHSVRTPDEYTTCRKEIVQRLGISESTRILVFVGRLDWQKDPMLLLEATRVVLESGVDVHLAVIGDGTLRRQVDDRIKSSPTLHGNVSLLGALPPSEIGTLLRASDMLVLSSAYEGMPIVVLEALASGIPVVTTDVGEVRLVVENGTNGFVVDSRDPSDLARGVVDILSLGDKAKGSACEKAVASYVPQVVLAKIYDNHRRQSAARQYC